MSQLIHKQPIEYTENEELGELQVIPDFLPSPQELATRAKKAGRVKVTIMLERDSIDFFKKVAQKHNVSYQKIIRMLLDEYVQTQERPRNSRRRDVAAD